VHCTTRLEIGFRRGFGQWLKLVHCANLLAVGPSNFYNQCPQVQNLIRTERSLNRSERRVRRKQAKSNLIDGFSDYRGISIDLDFDL